MRVVALVQRGEQDSLEPLALKMLPRSSRWLLSQADRPAAVLLRLRMVVGRLRLRGKLSSDAFKFIEERSEACACDMRTWHVHVACACGILPVGVASI